MADLNAPPNKQDLYKPARDFVLEAGRASTSQLQRKFGIGYARAAKLIDMLEARGVIGPADGVKSRSIVGPGNEGASDREFEAETSIEPAEPVTPEPSQLETKTVGRPTIFTQDLADTICRHIAEGESLRSIVKDEDMPSASTICRWLLDETKKPFWEQYEKARNVQAELMFDELLEIADDGENDWMERRYGDDESSTWVVNGETIQRSRLRVDTRKWYLSKVLPKKFGEKLDITSGGDSLAPDKETQAKVDKALTNFLTKHGTQANPGK